MRAASAATNDPTDTYGKGRRQSWYAEAPQMFGRRNGRITPADGRSIELRDLFAWSEEQDARW